MAETIGQFLNAEPLAVIVFGVLACAFVTVLLMAAGRVFLGVAALVFVALVLIMPNGAILLGGAVILGVVYLLTKSGVGSKSLTISKGDGDGDINVNM